MGEDIDNEVFLVRNNNLTEKIDLIGTEIKLDEIDQQTLFLSSEKNEDVCISLEKIECRILQKKIGLQHITRKRFIKLLMGIYIPKKTAEEWANLIFEKQGCYIYANYEYINDFIKTRIVEKLKLLIEEMSRGKSGKQPIGLVNSAYERRKIK